MPLTEVGYAGTTAAHVPFDRRPAEERSRVKLLYVSRECLLDLLRQGRGGRFLKVEGLPDDAEIVGVSEHYRFAVGQIVLAVWSASFPAVPEGNLRGELALWVSLYQDETVKEDKPTFTPVELDATDLVVRDDAAWADAVKSKPEAPDASGYKYGGLL